MDIIFGIFWPVLLVVYHYVTNGKKATKDEFEQIKQVQVVEKEARQKEDARILDRVKSIEGQIQHLPTKDDFQDLENSMIRIDEQVKSTNEVINIVSGTVNTIDQYLRGNSK